MLYLHVDEKISIRMLSGRDVHPLHAFIQTTSKETKYWLPLLTTLKTIDDCKQFIKNSLLLFAMRRGVIAGIFYDKKFIGLVGFNDIDFTNDTGSIGYMLNEAYRSKGIMTTVLRTFISYGFSKYCLQKVELRIATGNHASVRLAKRLNFSYDRTIENAEMLYGNYVAHDVYCMRKDDWQHAF